MDRENMLNLTEEKLADLRADHTAALHDHALAGEFSKGLTRFEDILDELAESTVSTALVVPVLELQADTCRNHAFTICRQAVDSKDSVCFAEAYDAMGDALSLTGPYVSGE